MVTKSRQKKTYWDDRRCAVVTMPGPKYYVIVDNEPWRSIAADTEGALDIFESEEDAKKAFEEDAAKRESKKK